MLPELLGAFAVLLVLRVPVAAAMGLSGAFAILTSDMDLPLAVVPQRIFVLLDSTALLAIPFFILAGAIMEQGGMARRMIDFAQAMVGHWRGGLAQVDVLASTIFSSLTGSSAASASATGSILIPAMKKAGYPAGYAAALEASSAAIGPIIPPSIIMIAGSPRRSEEPGPPAMPRHRADPRPSPMVWISDRGRLPVGLAIAGRRVPIPCRARVTCAPTRHHACGS
ncbi:MAG: hypothetical protein AcusKO_13030 [Acuticoccus sp.]